MALAAVGYRPMPQPCRNRTSTRPSAPLAQPYAREATTNTRAPASMNGRRPKRSAAQPVGGRRASELTAKLAMMKPTAASEAPSRRAKIGSAESSSRNDRKKLKALSQSTTNGRPVTAGVSRSGRQATIGAAPPPVNDGRAHEHDEAQDQPLHLAVGLGVAIVQQPEHDEPAAEHGRDVTRQPHEAQRHRP